MCNLKSFGCEHVDVGSRFSKIEISSLHLSMTSLSVSALLRCPVSLTRLFPQTLFGCSYPLYGTAGKKTPGFRARLTFISIDSSLQT